MKKLLSLILATTLVLSLFSIPAFAEDTASVYVNGAELKVDQPAIIVNGRTLVPLRAICEALNCKVFWDDSIRTASIENEVTIISVQIDNNKISKRDKATPVIVKEIEIDVAAQIYNDRTLVPARAISEALHAKVDWDGKNKRVDITYEYDYIGETNAFGLAIVKSNGKYGFINEKREVVIPLDYDYAYEFVCGLSGVKKDGKWGFINTEGETVIEFIYDEAIVFPDGNAYVQKKGEGTYIDLEAI